MLRALGVEPAQIPAETEEAAARFRSLVAERRLLVLLDNAASPDQVRPSGELRVVHGNATEGPVTGAFAVAAAPHRPRSWKDHSAGIAFRSPSCSTASAVQPATSSNSATIADAVKAELPSGR